jgi:hypothetical protein
MRPVRGARGSGACSSGAMPLALFCRRGITASLIAGVAEPCRLPGPARVRRNYGAMFM